MHAIRQHEHGGPEVLRYEEVPDPVPGPGQVRVHVEAIGVHLLDTSIRQGTSFGPLPPPELPMTPGREVAGVVDELGAGADPAWLGRRVVVHLGAASGGYAELAVADQDALFALADRVSATDAIAMVGTGRTALGILEAAAITADDIVLVTAAAGGLGALLVQAARAAGAFVVGVAGGPDKVQLAKDLGADVAIDYLADGWADRVRSALDGRGITLALDGVGGATGRAAFELVGAGGRMWLYGYSSGEQMRLSADDLFATSVSISAAIGPRMVNRPGGIRGLAQQALEDLAEGRWRPLVNPPFPLAGAAEAHRALESRRTVGKVVLVP